MGHWPQAWAERGDAHSKVSNHLAAIGRELGYRFNISLETRLIRVNEQPSTGKYIARHVHTEGYPSGGSAEYAKYAYWDGEKWQYDKEWRFSGPRSMDDARIEWYMLGPAMYQKD